MDYFDKLYDTRVKRKKKEKADLKEKRKKDLKQRVGNAKKRVSSAFSKGTSVTKFGKKSINSKDTGSKIDTKFKFGF